MCQTHASQRVSLLSDSCCLVLPRKWQPQAHNPALHIQLGHALLHASSTSSSCAGATRASLHVRFVVRHRAPTHFVDQRTALNLSITNAQLVAEADTVSRFPKVSALCVLKRVGARLARTCFDVPSRAFRTLLALLGANRVIKAHPRACVLQRTQMDGLAHGVAKGVRGP
jgi:hypothetical protein